MSTAPTPTQINLTHAIQVGGMLLGVGVGSVLQYVHSTPGALDGLGTYGGMAATLIAALYSGYQAARTNSQIKDAAAAVPTPPTIDGEQVDSVTHLLALAFAQAAAAGQSDKLQAITNVLLLAEKTK